jgi:hypothetical protein
MSRLRKIASENDANVNIDSLNTIKKLLTQLSDELDMAGYSIEKMQGDYGDIGDFEEVKNAINKLNNIAFQVLDNSEMMNKEVYPVLNKWLNDIVIKNQKG